MYKIKIYLLNTLFVIVFLLSFNSCHPEIANGQDDICHYYEYINVLMEVYCSKSKFSSKNAPDINSVRLSLQKIEQELRKDPVINEIATELKLKR